MATENYYQALEVSPNATSEEIKKAFRKQALKYHPDVAGDNMVAFEMYRRAKKAYDVLIDTKTRQEFHYKYFFTNYRQPETANPTSIANKAKQLSAFALALDPYRIDYEKLDFQVGQLLNETNIAVLKKNKDGHLNERIIGWVLDCTLVLPYKYIEPHHSLLATLSMGNEVLLVKIKRQSLRQKRVYYWEKCKLLSALALAIGLCAAMYWLVDKSK